MFSSLVGANSYDKLLYMEFVFLVIFCWLFVVASTLRIIHEFAFLSSIMLHSINLLGKG